MAKEARLFRHDGEGECPEVIRYLEGLSTENNPFVCQHLRVLAEDMKVIKNHGPPQRYEEGDLMCVCRAGKELTRRCGGLRRPRIGPDGLSFDCGYAPGGKIHIKL